jgi:hypothetical protein
MSCWSAFSYQNRRLQRWLALALAVVSISNVWAQDNLRWRWSNPTPHGGNVFDMTYGLGLAVQVAERGQIYTSEDLVFWEPRASQTTNSLRAVTFFGKRLIITGERGTVLYADSLADFKRVDLGTGDWLESVAASSNLLVAVGDNAAIYTSSTGTNWQRHTPPFSNWLRSVAYSPLLNLFAVVGESGRIATSGNGTSWTIRTSGTNRHLNYIRWETDGFWVVGEGGLTLTSANGTTWNPVATGATNTLFAAAALLDSRLVVGDREVRRREDSTWLNDLTATNDFPAPAWTYYRSLGLGSLYFIAGRSGMMAEGFKTNGTGSHVWVTRKQPIRNWLWEVQRLPDFYVTVGYAGTVMTSSDGIDWSLELVPSSVTNTVFLGVGGTTNCLLAVGDHGSVITSPHQLVSVVLTNADNTLTTNDVSTLGVFWYDQPRPVTNDLQGVTMFNNQFVVSGSQGRIMTSPDGTNWTLRATPVNTFLSGLAADANGLVAVGQAGVMLTSPDGANWTQLPSGTTNWIYRVRHLGNQFIAVGQNGTILASPDGTNWTSRVSGTTRWLNDLTWLADTYYIVGTQGAVLSSTNGVNWSYRGTITEKSLYGVAHHQGKLLAAGVEGAIVRSPVVPDLTPVQFLKYARVETNRHNLFLIAGQPDQRFTIDHTASFTNWNVGPTFEFLDSSGTLLILEDTGTNAVPQEFYRATLVP